MGILGLPNVGKSSLFNLLTEQSIPAENYPFCTIEPNESRCAVPDERYNVLCDVWKPLSTHPAYLQVTDIAGLIRGASEGAGLGNNFLSHIQQVDGLLHCVRAYENSDIIHVDSSVDPIRDLETIQSELCKKDLEIVGKAIANEDIAFKKSGGKLKVATAKFNKVASKLIAMLKANKPVIMGEWDNDEIALINDKFSLLTTKPMVYVINMSKDDYIENNNKWFPKIQDWINNQGGGAVVPLSIEWEEEFWLLKDDPAAIKELIEESKGRQSALQNLIKTGYKELNLINYFTAGDKEVRAWTVYKGSTAPEAAAAIHSDFEKLFIKAEVVSFDDYNSTFDGQKGMDAAKAAGKYRQEGKSYIVQDGDIIYFQIGSNSKKK